VRDNFEAGAQIAKMEAIYFAAIEQANARQAAQPT
jgi:hypothetical protein